MEVIILPDQQKAAYLVAQILAKELKARPRLVLGLATGRTMEPVYRPLVDMHREAGLDFSQWSTFNLDEYIGIPADHPCSYRHYMNELLFDRVNIFKANTHLPDGMAADLGAECQRYEAAITMGVGTILDYRRCLMLVAGKSKAAILAKAVEGPISSMVTASALQLHPRCQVVADEEAASELKEIEYHRWVFANEPEWAEFRYLL